MRRCKWLALLLVIACSGADDASSEAEIAVAVDVVDVASESFPVLIDAIGVVVPRPEGSAELASPGASRVTSIHVGVGDAVRAHQLLIALDPSVWAAQLADAEAAATAARQAAERAGRLVEQGILPRRDAEQAQAELARAEANLASARRTRALADVRTPIAGVVDRLDATLDQIVQEGDVLVRVVDPNGIEVLFRLAPDDAAHVRTGMPVRVGARASDTTSAAAPGRIIAVGASIDPVSGAVTARASVAPSSRRLRIGETIDGSIEVERHEQALSVPADAILEVAGDAATVFVVGADGLAHATPVRIGSRAAGRVEIIGGLAGDERVVAHGAYALRDSVRVTSRGTP